MTLADSPTRYREPTLDEVRDEADILRRIITDSGVESALTDILAEIDEWKANHPGGAIEERKRLANAFIAHVKAWVIQHRGAFFDDRMRTVL